MTTTSRADSADIPQRTEPRGANVTSAIVWSEPGDPAWRSARTLRGLARLGIRDPRLAVGVEDLRSAVASGPDSVWIIRCGTWPVAETWRAPPPSATGRPLCALGAVRGESAPAWSSIDFEHGPLPPTWSVYLEAPLARALSEKLGSGLDAALVALREECRPRVVRVPALDAGWDERLRVAEIVTSLQQGGAERVAIDLALALPREGLTSRLVALGGPTRALFPVPAGAVMLAWEREPDRAARAQRLGLALVADGIDVAHGHLLEADDVRALAASGVPLALTIHNVRPGWPLGLESLRASDATLLIGCARAVESEMRALGVPLAMRTVWNGANLDRIAIAEQPAASWRQKLGFAPEDFVLLAVANPRPQKRLERLPAILARLRQRLVAEGVAREARLVIAGAPSRASAAAILAQASLEREVERLALGPHVRLVGSVTEMAPLYRAADVFVSTSAHEGLSLAQLEALACDRPVVTTDVGGAQEVAARVPGVHLVPPDAGPDRYLEPLLAIAARPGLESAPMLRAHLSKERMASHCARLLRAVAGAAPRTRREGLLLVTNNFSTGGAQTSARRLLIALREAGVRTRAAVIQEQPQFPTPGRSALCAAGVPVLAVPPPEDAPTDRAVDLLLEAIDADPPEAVVFWNAIPEHKLLMADALFDTPVFDVSPGEMYFESLDRYFTKPRAGFPYDRAADYGARLSGVIVKYAAEAERARLTLGAAVHVIANGVPLRPKAARTPPNGHLRIGTLARLDPKKRVDLLLDALRLAAPRLPPYRLRSGGGAEPGSGDHVEELRRQAEGLDVEFLGDVTDPEAFLRELDLFALVAEPAGCPNASLEAMGQGLPVVATDVGGMREQIEDGVNGRLVSRNDPQALAEALVDLARNSEERSRLAEAGYARVSERFSLARMTASYREVLLGQSRG